MKRLYCLIVLSLLCGRLSAQHLHSFDFRDASLAAVLDTLAAVQDEYSISFIHNELEHLRISARIKNQTIKDVVSFSFLKADTEFTLVGRIMEIKENGEVIPFKQGDEEVVVTHTFRTKPAPEGTKTDLCATGEEEVFFENLDFTGQQDKKYVVFETLYLGTVTEGEGILKRYADANPQDKDIFPIEHSKPGDANQQVHTPTGGTDAEDVSGTKTVTYTDTVTLKDVVSFTGLEKDREYELHAVLYVRPEGTLKTEYTDEELASMVLKDKNGNPITASKTFVAKEENGKEEVVFTFDASFRSSTRCRPYRGMIRNL